MSSITKSGDAGSDARRIVRQHTERLLRESDRIKLNDHGLVELRDGNSDDPVTMTIEQLRSMVTIVEETKEYEEGVDPTGLSD